MNNSLKVCNLRCEGLENPMGLETLVPAFSWNIISEQKNSVQNNYRVIVVETDGCKKLWDTGKVESDDYLAVYAGESLQHHHAYQWKVSVQDNYGNSAESEYQSFETGLAQSEWKAKWIGCQSDHLNKNINQPDKEHMVQIFFAMVNNQEKSFEPDRRLDPCFTYRKFFYVDKPVEKNRLYITAHGLYDVKLNGKDVAKTRLNPGFTSYTKYLEYQVYALDNIRSGENCLTITLADGWYKGKFGMLGYGNNYGSELSVLAQLEILYKDKTTGSICSDETFEYHQSAYVYSDILIGEKYDARLEQDWSDTRNDDACWYDACVKDYPYDNLHGTVCEPVACTQIIKPLKILITPKGETIVDMGQNMVGVVQIKVTGESGTEITLEHSEVLSKDGNFINNVSGYNRDQTDIYILSGKGIEIFEPKFTFHGFRYVKISGYPGELKLENINGIVIGTALEKTGKFICSHEGLNQLQSNIFRSQIGNMLSIPTDCPQRERAGWTGDIQVYGETAVYNQNAKQFLRKWFKNIEKEQLPNGVIPVVIPYPFAYSAIQEAAFGTETSAGWGDVVVILPWVLYQTYNDERILKECLPMAEKWMSYVEKEARENMPEFEGEISTERKERQKYLWNTGFHFGDWCYPSCKNENGETDMFRSAYTSKELVATAMYAQSTGIMSKIYEVLGRTEDAAKYSALNKKIRRAFSDEYIDSDGKITNNIQGVYVLALAMEMTTAENHEKVVNQLVSMIKENEYCLDTGFISIKYLFDVLAGNGQIDVAKKLLYQTKCPSWLYEVNHGATTIWETWNAIFEDGTPTKASYNHYAFGCIGDWMYRNLLGIQKLSPGYKNILIKPDFRFDLSYAKGSFQCIYGRISCEWELIENKGMLSIQIPVNTTATVVLPDRLDQTFGSGSYKIDFSMDKING
jgi:alpha-L-rhamnosidase